MHASKRVLFGLSFLLPLLLAACNLKLNLHSIKTDVQNSTVLPPAVTCTISSPQSTVASGTTVDLPITISGGISPYTLQVVDRSVAVSPSFSIGHVFLNETNADAQQTFSITVADDVGTKATCAVTVMVRTSTPPPALTCSVTALPSVPEVNQPVALQFTAAGGQGNDTFSNLTVSGGSVTSALQSSGAKSAAAVALFTTGGSKPISALVTDENGHSASCALSLSVRAPRLNVTLNPASGIAASTSSITVTITPNDFAANSQPVYYFYTAESGVYVTANGNHATITDTDQSAHDFILTVAAVDPNNGDIATGFAHLVFTSTRQPLSCTVSLSARGASLYPVLPYYYYYYAASPVVPASAGASGVRITNVEVQGATYASYWQNNTTVAIDFFNSRILEPAQRDVTVELTITDNLGRTAECQTSAQVWAY